MTAPAKVVIVGASLAGLRTAEALRERGYDGRLSLVGAEAGPPYDRTPLSKQALSGWVSPSRTALPRLRSIDASWRLGAAAVRVDRRNRAVAMADGDRLGYDRLVVATGSRSRRWPVASEAALRGVHTLRTHEDAARLVEDLNAGPRRVLVIGAGFTGSEVASACRGRGLAVTMVETTKAPLANAVGASIGKWIAGRQEDAGVDLRCGVAVVGLIGDGAGRVAGATLSDGGRVEAEVVVVALGAVRNVEWLDGSDLDAGPDGCLCDASGRALESSGAAVEDIFVCGEIARFRHPLAREPVSLEHWSAATDHAAVVAANMLSPGSARLDDSLPRFWSNQFGMSLKASGLPAAADQVMIAQGSLDDGRFVALYGAGGRVVGVVAINQSKWMPFYEALIASASAFPPSARVVDQPAEVRPWPAGFPRAAGADPPAPVAAPPRRRLPVEDGAELLAAVADHANRADPYRLYEKLRERPVWRNAGGAYVVGRYRDVAALLQDPRLSSDPANSAQGGAALSFLNMDPPEHDRVRRMTMRHFGPPDHACRVERMRPALRAMVAALIDGLAGRTDADLVAEFSYPFPGRVIADLLGVPHEDEARFCAWAEAIAQATDRDSGYRSERAERTFHEVAGYVLGLTNRKRGRGGDDLLSGLVNAGGPEGALRPDEILRVSVLLLLAGHETTVNLISNGVLTLLRFPHVVERLRAEPASAPAIVEELLRFEPPVHILFRGALSDIEVGGALIPGGSAVQLMLGSANRDPEEFEAPDVFDPDRRGVRHLGFGGGIHACFGAPLARVETQIALAEIARRLVAPRLIEDPPPYRFNSALRGPRELRVAFDAIAP